jgi:hypothetical protein
VHGEERDELGQSPAVPERLRRSVDLDVPEHRNLNRDASPHWPRSRLARPSRSRQTLVPGSRTWSRMTLDLWRARGNDLELRELRDLGPRDPAPVAEGEGGLVSRLGGKLP